MAARGDNSRPRPGATVDVEPFRRALTGCIRSVAGDAEVEVVFANERPGMTGERIRLPELSKRPTPEELALCAPFLHRQVELVNPALLVTLGNVPTQALFETNQGITRMRGNWKTLNIGKWSGPVLPTLHPAFLLRTPGAKAQAWKDMLSLTREIRNRGI